MTLVCPLCCTKTFGSHTALKNHIVRVQENLKCPACDKHVEDIQELVAHLDQCAIRFVPKTEVKEEEARNETIQFEEVVMNGDDQSSSNVEDIDSNLNEMIETEPNEDNLAVEQYYCKMCCIHFEDINAHLENHHKGQEFILEDDNPDPENETNDVETDTDYAFQQPEIAFVVNPSEDTEPQPEETDHSTPQPIQLDTVNREQEFKDREGRLYTRKLVKIDKFWLHDIESQEGAQESIDIEEITVQDPKEADSNVSVINLHQCPDCSLLFSDLDNYKKHKCNNSTFDCAYCSVSFTTQEGLRDHVSTHSEKLTLRVRNKAPTKPFVCDVCNTVFHTLKSLRLHSRMHDPVKTRHVEPPVTSDGTDDSVMFVCLICNKTYDKQYEEVHMNSHTANNDYNCEVCNRKFHTQSNLEMHVKAHSNNKKFACSYCKKPFVTYDSLQEHLTNQCQKRMYACQFCGRRFARPHEKVKHERIHTGEKPHVCDICGKAFRVSYCLTLHLRTHSGTRPYQCSHCGKRFKSHSVYNHHMLTHSDVRAYKCPYCPKAFKTSVQLAGHKNSHIKPFTCTDCNRPFATLYAVRAHMETHKRDNNLRYDCWTCGALYSRASALRDHIKQQHQNASLVETEGITLGVGGEMDANSILEKEDMILGLEDNTHIEIIDDEGPL